jgi:hypothetical protein
MFRILTHQAKYRNASLNDGDVLKNASLGDFVVVRTHTYTNLQSTVQPATHLGYMVQPIAPMLQTCTACYCTKYYRQL